MGRRRRTPPERQAAGAPAPEADGLRIDRWLWAARFFKTRGNAAEAVSGGKVHVNGRRVKPSRLVRPGDRLEIQRSGQRWVVTVRALSARRGPAEVARTLYEETAESRAAREAAREARRRERLAPARRPGGRDRRRLRELKGRAG